MNDLTHLPAWQQTQFEECRHPSGLFEQVVFDPDTDDITALLDSIAARFPARNAIVDANSCFSYLQLSSAIANIASNILQKLGSGSEPVVHLFEHTAEAVIAVLGILKAGKFYVALDNQLPQEQLRRIISHTGSRLICTDGENLNLAQTLADDGCAIVTIEELHSETETETELICDVFPDPDPAHYAYVIFTSGSTGEPKGVIESRRNLLFNSGLYANDHHICREDRCSLTQRLSFSGSKIAIFGTLLTGASLYLYDIRRRGFADLSHWIEHHRLTIVSLAPAVLRMLDQIEKDAAPFASIRLLRMTGDTVISDDLATFRRLLPDNAKLQIALGTTEVKLIAYILYDKQHSIGVEDVPVGWRWHETDFLIMDENRNQLANGEVGEIIACSRFVSPGYWQDTEQTSQKFWLAGKNSGRKFYATGDLGRIDTDGCLYHLGRIDSQVKIRGQRVELKEIELALNAVAGVQQAVVSVDKQTPQNQLLSAWIVWRSKETTKSISALRKVLQDKLPDYQIPNRFYYVETLPLNANRKIDRRRLTENAHTRPVLESEFVLPRSELERQIAQIWNDVLGIDAIGIHDNFFELGGDSIRAMQMLSRLEISNASAIHIHAIFHAPTVSEFACYMEENYSAELRSADTGKAGYLKSTSQDQALSDADIQHFQSLQTDSHGAGEALYHLQDKNPPALFILAPPRSGTTLLRIMLGGHPLLFAPPELYLLNYLTLKKRRFLNQGADSFRLEGSVRALMALHDWDLTYALEQMAAYEKKDLSTTEFYRLLQSGAGARLLVDKTPAYSSDMNYLYRTTAWFRTPVFIHLSRHPQAMIHSFTANHFELRSHINDNFTPQQMAELVWLNHHRNIFTFLQEIPAWQQLHLQYEVLVKQPEQVMNQVCELLGIELHTNMLKPYDNGHLRMTDGLYDESLMIGDPGFHRHQFIDDDRADRWRKEAKPVTLHNDSRELAEKLGYPMNDTL